jgi:hypothetical protein
MTEARDLKRLYWQAFAIRFAAGLLGWFLTFVVGLPFLEDANFYENLGAGVAEDWLAGRSNLWLDDAIAQQRSGWLMVAAVGVAYTIMGGIRFLPGLIAVFCLISSWTPVLTYRIARQLGQQPATARVGARLVAFSPAFAFWSGALYKDGLIVLALNLLVYHALLLQRNLRVRSILVVCGCLVALLGLRFYIAMIVGVVLAGGLLLGRPGRTSLERSCGVVFRQVTILTLVALALVVIGFDDSVLEQLPTSTEAALDRIDNSRRDLAWYSSRYLADANVRTPERALAFLPLGTAYFLTVPHPWQLGSLRQDLVIPETLFWLCLYPLIFVGIRRGLRRHFQGTVLVTALALAISLFYGLYMGNIGTAYRMRMQVWLLAAPFVGWGWEQFRRRRLAPVRRWNAATNGFRPRAVAQGKP